MFIIDESRVIYFTKNILNQIAVPRLMLTDKMWKKPKAILLEDRVYNKPEHRQTMEEIFIGCELDVLREIYLSVSEGEIQFAVGFWFRKGKNDYSKPLHEILILSENSSTEAM